MFNTDRPLPYWFSLPPCTLVSCTVQLNFGPRPITQAVVVLHQLNLYFWILHRFTHKWCKTLKSFWVQRKVCLKAPKIYVYFLFYFWLHKGRKNFSRKVLSKENNSTSEKSLHFQVLVDWKHKICLLCSTCSLHNLTHTNFSCIPPPLFCLQNSPPHPPLHSLIYTYLHHFIWGSTDSKFLFVNN